MIDNLIGQEALKEGRKQLAKITKEDINQILSYWKSQFINWRNDFMLKFNMWKIQTNIMLNTDNPDENYIVNPNAKTRQSLLQEEAFTDLLETCINGVILIENFRKDLTGQDITTKFVFVDSNNQIHILNTSQLTNIIEKTISFDRGKSTITNPFQLSYQIQDLQKELVNIQEENDEFRKRAQEASQEILLLKQRRNFKQQYLKIDSKDAEIILFMAQTGKTKYWLSKNYFKWHPFQKATYYGYNTPWTQGGDAGKIQSKLLAYNNSKQEIVYAKFSTIDSTTASIVQALEINDLAKLQQLYVEEAEKATNNLNKALDTEATKIFKRLQTIMK